MPLQVLSAAEIRTALPPGVAAPPGSAEEAADPAAGLSLSPAKPRLPRTRRGKPKTQTSPRPLGTDDGAFVKHINERHSSTTKRASVC